MERMKIIQKERRKGRKREIKKEVITNSWSCALRE
jgi:hypothetical protein